MTNYYLDCEFIEDGKTIDLISIGLIDDSDRKFYAISTEFNPRKANDWVKQNVLNNLPPRNVNLSDPSISPHIKDESLTWMSRKEIAKALLKFTDTGNSEPVFWGEWPSYDWVALCQLFGTMMDLPDYYPMRCNDVIQLAESIGFHYSDLPPSLETDSNHNALLGAQTVKMRYDWLMQQKQ